MQVMPGLGLIFDSYIGPDDERLDDVLAEAANWLVGQGISRREAAHLTTWRPGLVADDAYIADHDQHGLHFVQGDHDGARPVTVIHVPVPPDPGLEAA